MTIKHTLQPAATAHLEIAIAIQAPLQNTWDALTKDIGTWWREDFLVCEGSQGMRMDARLGGAVYEQTEANAGFIWGTIISFQPPKQLAYLAQIVPPWGGPAQSVVQITLEAHSDRPDAETQLTLTDSLIGQVTEETLTSLEEGWKMLYGDGGLKSYLESKHASKA